MRHAGPVDFHQDVVREIGLYIDILNSRERIFSIGPFVVGAKHIQRIIAVEMAAGDPDAEFGLSIPVCKAETERK